MDSCFNYSLLNVVLNGLMGKKNSRDYHFVRFGAVHAGSESPFGLVQCAPFRVRILKLHSSCSQHRLLFHWCDAQRCAAVIARGQARGPGSHSRSNINEGLSGKWIRSLFSGFLYRIWIALHHAAKDKIRTVHSQCNDDATGPCSTREDLVR